MVASSRREALRQLAGITVTLGVGTRSRTGLAQITNVRQDIRSATLKAEGILNEIAVRKRPVNEEFIKFVKGQDKFIRLDLVDTLAPLSLEEQENLTRPDRNNVTKLLIKNKIPLVPNRNEIEEIEIKEIEISDKPKTDEVLQIIIDIILDTFALFDVKEAIKEVVRGHNELNSALNEFTQKAIGRDWEAATPLLQKIIDIMISSEFVLKIESAMRKRYGQDATEKVLKRFAKSLSLKLVPFIGWFFFGIALMLSIRRHAHRFD